MKHTNRFSFILTLSGMTAALALCLLPTGCGKKESSGSGETAKKQTIQNKGSDTMVNLAQALCQRWRPKQPDFSVLDLKAHFRGLKYVAETLKLLPQKPEPIVIQQITTKIALLGAVNATYGEGIVLRFV